MPKRTLGRLSRIRLYRFIAYCNLLKIRDFYFRHLFYIAAVQQDIHLLFVILTHGDIAPFKHWWKFVRKYPLQYHVRVRA